MAAKGRKPINYSRTSAQGAREIGGSGWPRRPLLGP